MGAQRIELQYACAVTLHAVITDDGDAFISTTAVPSETAALSLAGCQDAALACPRFEPNPRRQKIHPETLPNCEDKHPLMCLTVLLIC